MSNTKTVALTSFEHPIEQAGKMVRLKNDTTNFYVLVDVRPENGTTLLFDYKVEDAWPSKVVPWEDVLVLSAVEVAEKLVGLFFNGGLQLHNK